MGQIYMGESPTRVSTYVCGLSCGVTGGGSDGADIHGGSMDGANMMYGGSRLAMHGADTCMGGLQLAMHGADMYVWGVSTSYTWGRYAGGVSD